MTTTTAAEALITRWPASFAPFAISSSVRCLYEYASTIKLNAIHCADSIVRIALVVIFLDESLAGES